MDGGNLIYEDEELRGDSYLDRFEGAYLPLEDASQVTVSDCTSGALLRSFREKMALWREVGAMSTSNIEDDNESVNDLSDQGGDAGLTIAGELRKELFRTASERVIDHWQNVISKHVSVDSEEIGSDAASNAAVADMCACALCNGVRALGQSVLVIERAGTRFLFIDVSIRNMSLSGDFLWHFIADCFLVLGRRQPDLVGRVLEVDFSGQQIGNAEASQLILALRDWPCVEKRTVRLVGCSLTGFTLSEEDRLQLHRRDATGGQHGIHQVVLNQCPIAHPNATNATGLFDGVVVLHLASTKIRSMWSLVEIVRTLSSTVEHLWLDQPPLVVPDWRAYPVPNEQLQPEYGERAERFRARPCLVNDLPSRVYKSTDPMNRPMQSAQRERRWRDRRAHPPSARTGAAAAARDSQRTIPSSGNCCPQGSNRALHQLLHCWCADTKSHLVRRLHKAATPKVSESKVEIFLAGHLPKIQSLNGHPICARARAKYHQHFESWSLDLNSDDVGSDHVLRRLRERETGGFGLPKTGPRSRLGTMERVAPLRLRYERPRARLVFPPHHRPRQFEYHPSVPGRIAVGTLHGTVMVTNTNVLGTLLAEVAITGAGPQARSVLSLSGSMHYLGEAVSQRGAVLGLCWLRHHPEMLLAGADDGALALVHFSADSPAKPMIETGFPEFAGLTSLHANASDEQFITSGYSIDVALYDIRKQQQIRLFRGCHRKHINVVKFSNHSPTVFATCSFDRGVALWDTRQQDHVYRRQMQRGNVMVCFSPDDSKMLVSGEDNQVIQLETWTGRALNELPIGHRGCAANYTRSYYMRCYETDYIITGSCEESIVRLFNAETGKQLCEVEMDCIREQLPESLESSCSDPHYRSEQQTAAVPVHHSYVQSLRPDPHQPFAFSTLLAYYQVNVCSDIMEVDLLS